MRFLALLIALSFVGVACSSKKKKEEVTVKPVVEAEVKKEEKKVETKKDEIVISEDEIETLEPVVEVQPYGEADVAVQYPNSVTVEAVDYDSINAQAGDVIAYKTVTTTTVEEFDVDDETVSETVTTVESSSSDDQEVLAYVDSNFGSTYTVQDFNRESSDLYIANDGVAVITSPATTRRVLTVGASFTNGLYQVSKRCNVRSAPSKGSDALGYISSGRVVWADDATTDFAKVYRKSGPAYIHKGCL